MCIEMMITKCDTYNIVYVIMTNLEMDWHHKLVFDEYDDDDSKVEAEEED